MENPKLAKLQELMKIANEGLTRKEFTDAFALVVNLVKEIKDKNLEEMSAMSDMVTTLSEKMKSDMSFKMTSTEREMMDYCKTEMAKMEKESVKMMKEHEKKMQAIDEKLAEVKSGDDEKDADEVRITEDILRRLPPPPFIEPKDVRDKLETLKGKERLDKSAIYGLEEMFKEEIKKINDRVSSIPRGGSRVSRNNIYQTLTPDGSTKVFSVPKNMGGVVIGSDFPTVLMENAGFTVNAARNQITLTVDNAPSLNSQLVFIGNGMFNVI